MIFECRAGNPDMRILISFIVAEIIIDKTPIICIDDWLHLMQMHKWISPIKDSIRIVRPNPCVLEPKGKTSVAIPHIR